MTGRFLALLLALPALCACAPGGESASDSGSTPAPSGQLGATAPNLEAKTLDGAPVSLASLAGSPVLLNVWATWCHPCREEIPVLEALHRRYEPKGLRIVGVTIDDAGAGPDIRSFADEFGVTYAIWHDADQRVMPAFNVIGVPTTFLIGRGGKVLWRKTGEVKAGDPGLAAALDSALAAGS